VKRAYLKPSMWDRLFDFFNIIFMLLLMFIMVYPFIFLLAISFNDGTDAIRGGIYFFPRVFSTDAYVFVLEDNKLIKGAIVSIARTVIGTIVTLLVTGLLSYVVTVRDFSGRKFMRLIFIITMYFGGGLIPSYLLMLKLGLTNSFHVYWLPAVISPYFMLLIASYMQGLPESLRESAKMDGARELTIYFRIIMPLSLPVYAAVAVFSGVNQWNSWFDVVLYNPNREWDTLQIILRRLLLDVQTLQDLQDARLMEQKYRELTPQTVRAAITIIVTLPIVLIYPFLQRFFIGGLTLGGVKG
jgi:putative aldouronate transport system permease protein